MPAIVIATSNQQSNEKGFIMTAPFLSTTSSKLILASAIACALLAGCNKHNDANTVPAATPAATPDSTAPATTPATPATVPGTTPATVNPDGTTTPPTTPPDNGTTPATGTTTPPASGS